MRLNKITFSDIMIIVGIICILGLMSFQYTIYPFATQNYCTITVIDKQIKSKSNSNNQIYMIWTKNHTTNKEEVFENTDCLILLKFNSSDIYGKLILNKTYEVHVYGWRIPYLSSYRNIVNILQEIKE